MGHLTLTHRQKIAEGIRAGKSNARMARELAVSPSTIGREIARNAESREKYAADFAQTLAASRQILAARDRFICAAEVYKPSAYSSTSSPYAHWSLPFVGWRESDTFTDRFSVCTSAFYSKAHGLAFTRFNKVSGMFRPSGARILPVTMRGDSRVRDTFSSSEAFSKTFSASCSAHSFSSFSAKKTIKLEERITLLVERPMHKSVAECTFMSSLSLKNKISRTIPAFSNQMGLPAKLQEGRSLLFAA